MALLTGVRLVFNLQMLNGKQFLYDLPWSDIHSITFQVLFTSFPLHTVYKFNQPVNNHFWHLNILLWNHLTSLVCYLALFCSLGMSYGLDCSAGQEVWHPCWRHTWEKDCLLQFICPSCHSPAPAHTQQSPAPSEHKALGHAAQGKKWSVQKNNKAMKEVGAEQKHWASVVVYCILSFLFSHLYFPSSKKVNNTVLDTL